MKDLDFDSVDVLAHILRRCLAMGYECGYTKAQKLLYCCYGAMLGLYGIRLTKEHPKCWQFGPVFPRAFNAHHKGRIKSNQCDPIANADEWLRFAIDETIDNFGKWTAGQLVDWSHKPGSPWSVSSSGGTDLYKNVDDFLIAADFKKIIKLNEGDPRPNGI